MTAFNTMSLSTFWIISDVKKVNLRLEFHFSISPFVYTWVPSAGTRWRYISSLSFGKIPVISRVERSIKSSLTWPLHRGCVLSALAEEKKGGSLFMSHWYTWHTAHCGPGGVWGCLGLVGYTSAKSKCNKTRIKGNRVMWSVFKPGQSVSPVDVWTTLLIVQECGINEFSRIKCKTLKLRVTKIAADSRPLQTCILTMSDRWEGLEKARPKVLVTHWSWSRVRGGWGKPCSDHSLD